MIYQHPLAYLLGLEGIALLHAYAGEYDREFTEARLAEIRALLNTDLELGDGATAHRVSTLAGYRGWAPSYDSPGNQLIDIEQPIVREILASLSVGNALDAACGSGRHAAYLASLGHTVIGVDSSPDMLARARDKVSGGEFRQGDLEHLPVPDQHVDLVVCALALTHVPDLAPVLAEFVRVMRPGGHVVISDSRGILEGLGMPMVNPGPDGRSAFMQNRPRRTSEYLKAALPLGLQVRRCEEPGRPYPLVRPDGTPTADEGPLPDYNPKEPGDIWSLHRFAAEATNVAYRDKPVAIIWHFQLCNG